MNPMIRVGKCNINRVEELTLREPAPLFAEWRKEMVDEHRSWLVPHFYDVEADAFIVAVQSWIVQTPQHTLIIDTCGGNDKERSASPRFHRLQTPYLDRLRALGVAPDEVDFVICTHLHADHVGWNSRLVDSRWVATFPNAQYVLSRIECENLDPRRTSERVPYHQVFVDSVLPVIESGQARLVEGGEAIAEGVDIVSASGHTPGQIVVRVRSAGEEALFLGDVMHHPLQIYHLWNTKYCADPEQARRKRVEILEHCAANNTLVCPTHFAFPHCGRVARNGDGFSFVPADIRPE